MAPEKFEVMAAIEREHWWFGAKRALVLQEAARADVDHGGLAIDVGCGTGAVLEALASRFGRAVGKRTAWLRFMRSTGHARTQ